MRGKNIDASGATIKCTDVHVKKTDVRTGVRKEKMDSIMNGKKNLIMYRLCRNRQHLDG